MEKWKNELNLNPNPETLIVGGAKLHQCPIPKSQQY